MLFIVPKPLWPCDHVTAPYRTDPFSLLSDSDCTQQRLYRGCSAAGAFPWRTHAGVGVEWGLVAAALAGCGQWQGRALAHMLRPSCMHLCVVTLKQPGVQASRYMGAAKQLIFPPVSRKQFIAVACSDTCSSVVWLSPPRQSMVVFWGLFCFKKLFVLGY